MDASIPYHLMFGGSSAKSSVMYHYEGNIRNRETMYSFVENMTILIKYHDQEVKRMDRYYCTHDGTPFEHAKPYHLDYKFGPGHNAPLCLVCGRMMVKGEGKQ